MNKTNTLIQKMQTMQPTSTDIIRRRTYGKTGCTEETFDFTNHEDRKDIFAQIIHDAYFTNGYHPEVLDTLMSEMKASIADFKANLPLI